MYLPRSFVVITGSIIAVLVLLVVMLVSAVIAPRVPHALEIQQALDIHAATHGLCPQYSRLNIWEDGTWSCSPK